MKTKSIFLVLILLLAGTLCIPVSAQNVDKTLPDIVLEEELLSEEQKEKYAAAFWLRALEYDPQIYESLWLERIDVSQTEKIALVFSNDTVVVADKEFQKPVILRFVASDPPYDVNWIGDNLEIISNRSALAYTVSPDGELINVSQKVQDPVLASLSRKTSDTVMGYTYQLKRSDTSIFSGGNDLLVRTDEAGNEQILFRSTATVPVENIIDIVLPLVGILAFVVFIIVSTLHLRRKRIRDAQKRTSAG